MNAARDPHENTIAFRSPSGTTTGRLQAYRKGKMLCMRVTLDTSRGPIDAKICIDPQLAAAAHKLGRTAWERWSARLKQMETAHAMSVGQASTPDGSYRGAIGGMQQSLERMNALENNNGGTALPVEYGADGYPLQTGWGMEDQLSDVARAIHGGQRPSGGARQALPLDAHSFLICLAAAAGHKPSQSKVVAMHGRGQLAPYAHAAHSLLAAPSDHRRAALTRWLQHPEHAKQIMATLERIEGLHPTSSAASQWAHMARDLAGISPYPMQPGAQLPFMQSIGAADAGAYTTDRNALRLNWMYGSPGGLGSTYGMPRVGTADAGAYTTDRNALRLNWMYGSPGGLGSTYGMPRVGAEPTAPTSTDLAALPIDMRAVVACVLAECKCPTAQDVVKSVLDQPQGLQYLEEAERIAAGGSGLRMAFTRNWAHNQANCDLLCRAMLAAAKAYPECVLARAWADTCCAVLPNLASAAAAASAPKTAGTFTGPTIGAFSTKAYHEMGRKIQVGADTVAALASSPPVALAKSPPSPEANLIAARSIAQQIEEIHHLLPEGHAMLVSLLVEEVCRALRLLDLAGRDPKVMAELARQVRGIGRKSKKLKGALLLAEELQTKGTVRLPPLG